MRKNFLILMLLSLLPLAGWADGRQLTNSDVSVASVTYNGNSLSLTSVVPVVTDGTTELVRNTDYTWDGKYYTTSACTTEVTPKNVGTYWVKIVGAGSYNGEAVTSFAIQPATLTVTLKKSSTDVTSIVKKFGAANPALTADSRAVGVTGLKSGDTESAVVDLSNASYTYTGTAANVAYNATTGTGYPIKFQNITLKGDNPNYVLAYPEVQMLIQKISLLNEADAATKLSIVKSNAPTTYNGTNQAEPTYTVTWDGTTLQKMTNGTNKDFKVTYTKDGSDVEANAIKNAGTYVATITGLGNYEGSVTAEAYNFTIAGVDLYVGVEPITKTYKGANYTDTDLASDYEFYFDGLKAGDAESDITKSATVEATNKNVGEYTITVTASYSNANYTIHAENSTLTITPKSGLTITANKATKVYGPLSATNTLKYLTLNASNEEVVTTDKFTVTGAVKDADASIDENTYATFSDAIDVAVSESAINATTHNGAVTLSAKDIDDSEDGVQLHQALKNYTNIQYVPANLVITKAPLRFTPKNISKTYGQADADVVTWNTAVTADKVRVRGYQYTDDASVITAYPKLRRTNASENAAEYELEAYDASVNDNYEPQYETGKFIINKKALKVTATDQTFVVGTTTLNTTAYTIDTEKGLVSGDAANKVFKLQLADGVTGAKYTNELFELVAAFASNKFTGVPDNAGNYDDDNDASTPDVAYNTGWAEGVYAGGVTIVPFEGSGSKAANYDFTIASNFTAGKVIVLSNETSNLLLDDAKATLITEIAAANGNNKNITFTSRVLNAEKWNVMVLPFTVTMNDLCTALGEYVVADVLVDKGDNNAHFKINLDQIPANTPFLLMPKTAKNMNTVTFSKPIKYVTDDEDPTADQLDANGNPYVETEAGVKFIGTYKTAEFYGAAYQYMSGGKFKNASLYTATNKVSVKPLRAYLDLSGVDASAAPVIYIEEPDGSTTAISTINAENIVEDYSKEGWYTVNGVKLNDMPTVKGVFIHNGKKVVVK